MRKEPLFFSIVRALAVLAGAFLLGLLWLSSERVEKELINIKELLEVIKTKVNEPPPTLAFKQIQTHKIERKWDPSLPNLLEEDLYYAKTLPEQLGKDFTPYGTRREATFGKPNNLHPFGNWSEVNTWNAMCNVAVGRNKFGIFETLAPDMALKMEVRGDPPEYWIYLRENVFWQPLERSWFPPNFELSDTFLKKHPVTAHDYKFYFDAFMNPAVAETGAVALRTLFADVEELRVIDDLTFVVKWKTPKYISKQLSAALKPLPRHVYQSFSDGSKIIEEDKDPDTYRKNPIFALNFSKHWAKNIIVSCGGWVFQGMTDRMIRFKRNPDHYFPYDVLVQDMEVEIRSSPDTIWQDFKEKKFDNYLIRPNQLLELTNFLKTPLYKKQESENAGIERLDYIDRSYTYVGWNEARELFRSKKVRQALTMGIDRERIIRQTLNGMGILIHGSFLTSSPSNNPAIRPWPFDPQKAKQMLEEEGWYDSNGDGVIDTTLNGKNISFRFTLTYFVKNPTSKSVAEYIAMALSDLGVRVDLNGVDMADISKVFEDKDFDALLLAWGLGSPPENPRQLWYSTEAKKKGSSNAVGFQNVEADHIIDQLDYEKDPKKRIALYHRFDEIIHEEQPYTFLYTPKQGLLWRSWLQNIFIPADRQDLIPGANIPEPDLTVTWLRRG